MDALRHGGHQVELASTLRAWEGRGDTQRQNRIRRVGERLAVHLVKRYSNRPALKRPQVWFTYHLYHRAPDWLGPMISDALSIPYVVAEASHAPKQAKGPWAVGHVAVAEAIRQAQVVIPLTSVDAVCVRPLLSDQSRLVPLKPFIDVDRFVLQRPQQRVTVAGQLGLDTGHPWLIAVGMMREGDKLASYRVLASALEGMLDKRWNLLIVGDGPARRTVEGAFRSLSDRVSFAGLKSIDSMPVLYSVADLCVWPAINESYGMSLLEAQAAGLPVVAARTGGVMDVVRDGVSGLLVSPGDVHAFRQAMSTLLCDPERREQMGRAAQNLALSEHDISEAAATLNQALTMVTA